jgi:hypothetical protein
VISHVQHPFPGLSGEKTIPLSVNKRWLTKRMKETGWTAQQCAEIEFLTSAKDAIAKTCQLAARINREYSKAFANDAAGDAGK